MVNYKDNTLPYPSKTQHILQYIMLLKLLRAEHLNIFNYNIATLIVSKFKIYLLLHVKRAVL